MNLNVSSHLTSTSGPADKDSGPPLPPDGAANAPASRVWRICQGETVAAESAAHLELAFGRLGAFLDRHLGEVLDTVPRSLTASSGRRCRPSSDAAAIGYGGNVHVR